MTETKQENEPHPSTRFRKIVIGSSHMIKIFLKGSFCLVLFLCCASGLAAETKSAQPDWPAASPDAIAHWQSLRFGMFIHWGPSSLTEQEISWSRGKPTPIEVYDNLYHQFNPTNFNADEWVGIAKAAGMKYIVLTTKHHDGFCLWDTKLTDYNIMNSPFKRDVVKELVAACKKQGIEFGAYYSTCDWYNTNWPDGSRVNKGRPNLKEFDLESNLAAYGKYMRGQIAELINNYGPLLTIWQDLPGWSNGGKGKLTSYGRRGAATIQLVRQLQPDILINNRTGDGGDYDTPEQKIGKFQLDRPWESCMTVSAHNHWSWRGADDGVKSTAECLEMLIRGAGGDGNVLLNVGPRPDGMIDPAQANLLKEVGAWLAKNGESIYDTRGGPWQPSKTIASTRKGNTVYLHVLKSETGKIELPALPAEIKSAALLNGGKVEFSQKDGKLSITIPVSALEPMDTIVKLELDRPALKIPVLTFSRPRIKATASNVYDNQNKEYGPQKAFDKDPQTRWATDSDAKQVWIAADLGQPVAIEGVRIPGREDRVTKFNFQYRDGGEWKTIFSGDKFGDKFEKKFAPVKAQEFRLNILDSTGGTTIREIELIEKEP